MAETYTAAKKAYLSLSDEFTELNKQYNRAVHDDTVTDELELRFLKAEKTLHEAYRSMQDVKASEIVPGKHPDKDKVK